MIVTETAGGYQFVTQPAHARLAGRLADDWGGGRFDRPDPAAAVLVAAYNHDTGWWPYDSRPHLDGDGQPVDFREMPADVWTGLYDEGVETVAAVDRYAGLLVSMHGAGLRNQRYGLSPSWPETPPDYEPFVAGQERRQRELFEEIRTRGGPVSDADDRLLAALHESGSPPDGARSALWRNYRLLQAWDTLSLSFCVTDSPPGYPRVDAVPTGPDRPDATLSVESVAADTYSVDPYPFESDPLELSVPVRTVDSGFDTDDDLVAAYYRAGCERRPLTLVPAADDE